jgi:PhoH-like ATPase
MLSLHTIKANSDVINQLYAAKSGIFSFENPTIAVNSYALIQDEADPKHAAIARYCGSRRWTLVKNNKELSVNGFSPRDAHQTAFMDALRNPEILLNVCVGTAGTGKTTLALASALADYTANKRRIILSKPTAMVGLGKAFGPVPGSAEEKFDPYLGSYKIILNKLLSGPSYLEKMIEKGDLQFQPVELSRGCTFEDATFILDEAQNLNWHEMNTIISRMGENSKMIILGDLHQIDIPLPREQTGLYKLITATPFQHSAISSAIELQNQYRSAITALMAEVNQWVHRTH